MERLAEHPSASQQRVIVGPGIDADAQQLWFLARGGRKTRHRVVVQLRHPPMQAIRLMHRTVGKPTDGHEAQLVVPDVAEHDATASCAEINRCYSVDHAAPSACAK